MKNPLLINFSVFCILCNTACASIPLASAYKLNQIDLNTTNFENFQAAVIVDDTYQIDKDGVFVNIHLEGADPTSSPTLNLSLERNDILSESLSFVTLKPNESVSRYVVSPSNQVKIDNFRQNVSRFRRNTIGTKTPLEFEAYAKGCVEQTANLNDNLIMSIFLKTSPEKSFFPVFKNLKFKLEDLVGDGVKAPKFCE